MKHLVSVFVLLLCAASARSDSLQPNSVYVLNLGPSGPVRALDASRVLAGQGFWIDDAFMIAMPFLGGFLDYACAIYGTPNNSTAGVLGQVAGLEPPPGFVEDPNIAPTDQWPFDIADGGIAAFASVRYTPRGNGFVFAPGTYGDIVVTGAAQPQIAKITTPEPPTGLLMLALIAVYILARTVVSRLFKPWYIYP